MSSPKSPAPPDDENQPGFFSRMFSAIVGWPRSLTLPGCASVILAAFLVLAAIVVWVAFLIDPNNIPWRHSLTLSRILAVLVLLVVVPIVTYRGLRLWLEGDKSRFPDVDYAWKAGVEALRRNGLSIDSIPIFLILGSRSEQQERAMMHASSLSFRVAGIPEGPAPLHWYGNPDRIYIFCTEAGWSSALASYMDKRAAQPNGLDLSVPQPTQQPPAVAQPQPIPQPTAAANPTSPPAPQMPAPAARRTTPPASSGGLLQPRSPAPPAAAQPAAPLPVPADSAPAAPPADQVRGTMNVSQFISSQDSPGQEPAGALPPPAPGSSILGGIATSSPGQTAPAAGSPRPPQNITGTLVVQSPAAVAPSQPQPPVPQVPAAQPAPQQAPPKPSSAIVQPAPAAAAPQASGEQPPVLATQDSTEQVERLQYVCQLLKRVRQPLCAINGILTLLQFRMVQTGRRETTELQQAIRTDLLTVQRSLELRAPVTTMIVGLEDGTGFSELVRRVGRERAAIQRFGGRFDTRSIPTPDELFALSAHVCGTFEDWVYTLFREKGALSRTGNTQLYGLLCRVRCNLKGRLAAILGQGFGYDARLHGDDDPISFSGCYFAATGQTEDRQAFVRGVLDKLEEEQEDVEWTTRALVNDRRYFWLACTGIVLSAALVGSLAWMIVAG